MKHIARSSIILAVFFALDKVLALFRQIIIARVFGLSYELDVFNAANNIPDLLSALISGGALGVALIPVLSEYLEHKGRPQAWKLFSRILNLAFVVTGSIAVLIVIFANPIVRFVVAPGFPAEQQALTIELMRLDLLAIVIFSISGLVMAGLQANQHFLLTAMAPAMYNIGQIFGVAILAPESGYKIGPLSLPGYGLGIHGLVYGVIIGAAFHLLIQVPGLIRYQFRWHPAIDIRHHSVKQVLALLGPRVLTMLFIHVFFVTRDNLASHLEEGAVTALNYGWFIMQVPETMLGTAISIALLPTLAEYIARGDKDKYREMINRIVRVMIALTVPAAALLIVGLPSLVSILGFDQAGSDLVVLASRIYLLGITGHALLEVAVRAFYAQQDARTPLFAAAINAVVYVILAVWLSRWLGFSGIAIANVVSFSSEALLLYYLLNRQMPGFLKLGRAPLRILVISAVGAGLVFFLLQILPLSGVLSGAIAVGMGALAVMPFIWPEIRLLLKL